MIQLLDEERNDIYVHVNKKVEKFNFDKYKAMVKKSKIVFSKKRVAVFWGSPLLLEAEMILLRLAYNSGKYSYFHLLSGADLPIKSMDYIYNFFEENIGREFVKFEDNLRIDLLKYYYPFLVMKRRVIHHKYVEVIRDKFFINSLKLQKKLRIFKV